MLEGLLHVGFKNYVSFSRIVAIVDPNSLPVRKLINEAKKNRKIIDLTKGKKTKSLIITNTDYLLLTAIQPETIANRLKNFLNTENER